MAGGVGIFVLFFFWGAAALWLCLGSRFRFTPSQAENDLANFIGYFGLSVPIMLVIVLLIG